LFFSHLFEGLFSMKKFLSLAIVAAAFAASIGCDDKKTSAPAKSSGSASAAPVTPPAPTPDKK